MYDTLERNKSNLWGKRLLRLRVYNNLFKAGRGIPIYKLYRYVSLYMSLFNPSLPNPNTAPFLNYKKNAALLVIWIRVRSYLKKPINIVSRRSSNFGPAFIRFCLCSIHVISVGSIKRRPTFSIILHSKVLVANISSHQRALAYGCVHVVPVDKDSEICVFMWQSAENFFVFEASNWLKLRQWVCKKLKKRNCHTEPSSRFPLSRAVFNFYFYLSNKVLYCIL